MKSTIQRLTDLIPYVKRIHQRKNEVDCMDKLIQEYRGLMEQHSHSSIDFYHREEASLDYMERMYHAER